MKLKKKMVVIIEVDNVDQTKCEIMCHFRTYHDCEWCNLYNEELSEDLERCPACMAAFA